MPPAQPRRPLFPQIMAGGVHGQVLSDGQEPGAEVLRLLEPAQPTIGGEQRLLEQVLRALAVAGFEVEPGEDEPGRTADQFLERGPVAVPSFPYQGYFTLDHAHK